MAGLNPKEAGDMANFIGTLREGGITILMIEHVMKAIMGLSDRLVVLNYGKKLTEGKPAESRQRPPGYRSVPRESETQLENA